MSDLEHSARLREGIANAVTLFTTTGTLVCCAIPIVLVTLGLGSVVIGLTNTAPWIISLTKHKIWVFAGSSLLLATSAWMLYRPGRTCPADPELAKHCVMVDKWNRRVYWTSVVLWATGFSAAYLALPIAKLVGY